jgi:hypothetical protein
MQPQTGKEHWILRLTPERHRHRVIRIGFIFGAACHAVLMLCGCFGLFFAPLSFAVWRPAAPIAQPVIWLRRISGAEAFPLTYTLVMCAIIAIVFTGYAFHESLRKQPNA